MSHHLRPLLRKPLPSSLPHRLHLRRPAPHRTYTSPPPSPDTTSQARLSRLLSRLPKFLRPYTDGLRTAPVSHIVSFLILHEITAIVPLLGLAGAFHYTGFLWSSESPGGGLGRRIEEWRGVSEGMERFGRYFGRKGWFGFQAQGQEGETETVERVGKIEDGGQEGLVERTERRYNVGEQGGRILVEVASAYAVTKILLPVRIMVSVWGTPWFARAVLGRVRGVFGRGA